MPSNPATEEKSVKAYCPYTAHATKFFTIVLYTGNDVHYELCSTNIVAISVGSVRALKPNCQTVT